MNVHDALYKAAHAYPGGIEAVAVRMNKGAQVLRNKLNPNSMSNAVSVAEFDDLLEIVGHAPLHALAGNHGYVCVKVEDGATASDLAVLELVTKVWSANGDVGTQVHETLADGVVEPHEIARVEASVYRVNQCLQQMVARLKGMAEPDPRQTRE